MNLTITQLEYIADGLKSAGYDVSHLDNDQLALIAQCVIDALEIEL